jgi:Ion transport protein
MATFIFSPKSKFKLVWELVIITLALIISLFLPFCISMKPPITYTMGYEVMMLLIDLVFFIDMVFTFRSATVDIMTGDEITEPHAIAKRYVLSPAFTLDALSCMPWDQFGDSDVFDLLGLFKIYRVSKLGAILNKLNVKSETKVVSYLLLILYEANATREPDFLVDPVSAYAWVRYLLRIVV